MGNALCEPILQYIPRYTAARLVYYTGSISPREGTCNVPIVTYLRVSALRSGRREVTRGDAAVCQITSDTFLLYVLVKLPLVDARMLVYAYTVGVY